MKTDGGTKKAIERVGIWLHRCARMLDLNNLPYPLAPYHSTSAQIITGGRRTAMAEAPREDASSEIQGLVLWMGQRKRWAACRDRLWLWATIVGLERALVDRGRAEISEKGNPSLSGSEGLTLKCLRSR